MAALIGNTMPKWVVRGGGEDVMDEPAVHAAIPIDERMYVTYAWYMSNTAVVTVSEARRELASIIDRARDEHAPIYLARRGRRVAAVIDADDLDRILELAEDMADIRAAEGARAEMQATGEAPIPWQQVKADLGLT